MCYNTALGGSGSSLEEDKKRIYMFDLNGNYLRTFTCAREAAEYLEQEDIYSTMKAIRNNCLGTANSSFGYFWSYKKEFTHKESDKLRKVA